MKTKKEIDYYGDQDNYIHLKFGHARKMYNFTTDFIKDYPIFAREYARHFEGEVSQFQNPFQIVRYVFDNKIPVHFYYNFSDEPAKGLKSIMDYLAREHGFISELK